MPDATTFGQDPIPTGPEAAWLPGALMAYAESIDPKLVHAATSQADRDSRYATLPVGSLVTWAAGRTIWMKTAGGWERVFFDSGWVTAGFTYPDINWAAGSYARARNRNGIIEVRAEVTYNGPTTAYPSGDLSNVTVAVVPTAYRATNGVVLPLTGYNNGRSVGMAGTSNGELRLVSVPPGASLVNGSALNVSGTWLEG